MGPSFLTYDRLCVRYSPKGRWRFGPPLWHAVPVRPSWKAFRHAVTYRFSLGRVQGFTMRSGRRWHASLTPKESSNRTGERDFGPLIVSKASLVWNCSAHNCPRRCNSTVSLGWFFFGNSFWGGLKGKPKGQPHFLFGHTQISPFGDSPYAGLSSGWAVALFDL